MAVCGIASGITASCSDLRRVGGVNKRAWLFNIDGVSYTTDSEGYITAITFPTYEGLYTFESQKKSHSGGYTLVNQAGGNKFFQHDAIMKLFATTPADDEVIEDLTTAQVGLILQTNNGEFILYGKDNGMDMSAATQNSGTESASDTTDTLTFMGEERDKPKRVFTVSAAATLALLESYEV